MGSDYACLGEYHPSTYFNRQSALLCPGLKGAVFASYFTSWKTDDRTYQEEHSLLQSSSRMFINTAQSDEFSIGN